MRPFRFRAAAALDLRRQREETARLDLARAQMAAQQAQQRVADADRATQAAGEQLIAAQRGGLESWRLGWHQSWIEKRRLEATECRRTVAVSATTVERAIASVNVAHQQRRALERLRDRAWRRHQHEDSRQASREMNLLATLRHLALGAGTGGPNDDD